MRSLTILLTLLTLGASTAQAQRVPEASLPAANNWDNPLPRLDLGEPLAHLLVADCDLDRTRGREAARNHSGMGWMVGGFVSGVLLGLIGTGIAFLMANGSTIEVDSVPADAEATCYRDGYRARARSTNTTSALTGGLVGTALFVVWFVSANSSSGY